MKTAILDGKDVNLASQLILHFDLGVYSRYEGGDGSHLFLCPLSLDARLNRNLTLTEFTSAFNKYRNVFVWNVVQAQIAWCLQGNCGRDCLKDIMYCLKWISQGFTRSVRSPYPTAHCYVRMWVRDNRLFWKIFVGQTPKVCSLCGSAAHLSGILPHAG